MTKKTRYFLFGAVGFIVAGLSIGLVAYYGGLPGIAFSNTAGPDELRYVPKTAVVVAYANVHDIMTSQFRQRFKEYEGQAGAGEGQREVRDSLGIDIENDIDYVVACMLPGPGSPDKSGLVVAKGRFDRQRIETFIKDHDGVAEAYKGRTIYTHPKENHGELMGVAFIQNDVVAMGSVAAIKSALDVESAGTSVVASTEVMDMVRKVEDGNVWAVGRFDALAGHARLPEQVASQIPAITWFSASGQVNGGVTGHLSVEARDDEAAKNLRDVVGGFMAFGRLQAGSKPEIQSLLNSIQLGGEAKTVTLSFTVPSEVFDALKSMADSKMKKGTDQK